MTVQSQRTTRALDKSLSALLILMLVGCKAAAAPDPDIEESVQLSRRFQMEPTVAAAVIPANEMFPEWRPELLRYLVGGGFRDDSTLGFQLAHSAVIMSDGSIFLASYRPPFVRYSAARGNVAHLGVTGEGRVSTARFNGSPASAATRSGYGTESCGGWQRSIPKGVSSPKPGRRRSFEMRSSSGRAGSLTTGAYWRSVDGAFQKLLGT